MTSKAAFRPTSGVQRPQSAIRRLRPSAAQGWAESALAGIAGSAALEGRLRRCMTDDDACRHVENRGDTADLSVSRSDRDIDRQVQLDETRLQQRHGQVITQFNPGVGVAWRPPELLEDDLAGLPKR